MAILVKHISDPPTPLAAKKPELPQNICKLVDQMIEKSPDARPQTMDDIVESLTQIQRASA